jgi:hypothetical protein
LEEKRLSSFSRKFFKRGIIMDFKELGKNIFNSAPSIGSLFGAPGMAIGGGIKALASVFGLTDKASADDIDQAIKAAPDAALKLKMAEMDYNIQLQKNENELIGAYIKDVQNAREREKENTKNTGKKDVYLYALASVIVVGFFALCATLMYRPLPTGSNEVVFMLFGTLSAAVGSVIGYFFGSSKSSADKTDILASKK